MVDEVVKGEEMASTSMGKQTKYEYPAALARYEDVAANPKLFMETLEKLHACMRTKFMIPIIGGRELDLHRLFLEVTARGGLDKIIQERRWKEVTAIFNFPSTATNASFVLRKYYASLLHHYEHLYFFQSRGSSVPPQTPSLSRPPSHPPQLFEAAAASGSCQVVGVIDGKFESGYLVTVTMGSEKLKGVLYQAPRTQRRRRRKKNEIRRRDPAHPKPNRSGYNFFFAEQHARLKPLYPGRDREISRMIGELWNKLNETQRSVYQEKAVKDKERYQTEMEVYRAKLKGQQVVSNVIPIQQWAPEQQQDSDMKTDETAGDSLHTGDNGSTSYEEDETKSSQRVGSFGVNSDEMDIDNSGKEETLEDNNADKSLENIRNQTQKE